MTNNTQRQNNLKALFAGGGDIGRLLQAIDWSKNPLGALEQWPQSLQTAVSMCLYSRFPMFICWGAEFIQIYNDAYRPILGTTKHPSALGQRGSETWSEIWHIIGPMLESVYRDGNATWSDEQMFLLNRHGFTEESYFTFSYSPIFDESGGIGGIFSAVTDTSKRVLGDRRLRTLRALGARTAEVQSAEKACVIAANIFSNNAADIPFALIYLLDERKEKAYLVGYSGVESGLAISPKVIDVATDATWHMLAQITTFDQTTVLENLAERFGTVPSGIWEEPPHTALILPIVIAGQVSGYVIAGVSSRLLFDEEYRGFFGLIAGQISTAVANARAYEAERKRAEALAELDRTKTEFFSNVSHEFRTPLTLILNPLQEVLNATENQLNPTQQENLLTVQRNSLRLLKLVNSLLDFSRIQSNRIEASYEATDLSTVTADLASTFRSAVERAEMRLIVECPVLPEPIYVDREMWEKIVLNLLSNAFKFTFEGEIRVTLSALPESVELTISDTGIGVSAEELPQLFQRFHRVRGAKARTYEGSGIGLALVQELVRFHGGQIGVTSELGQGTTFKISIPRGFAHLPADHISAPRTLTSTAMGSAPFVEEALRWLPTANPNEDDPPLLVSTDADALISIPYSGGDMSGSRVLVVDDNVDMRDYLSRLLGQRYQVETASDGQIALAMIQQHPPDLALVDVMMPNLDGFGLLQKIRSDSRVQTLPVILLSARAGEEARVEGLEAGADDYLVKPFSMRELMAHVETNLQISHLRHEIVSKEQDARTEIERIIEGIADPFYAMDNAWRFVYINRKAQEMLGQPRETLIGTNIWDTFSPAGAPQAYEQMQRAIREQHPVTFETFSDFLNSWVEINIYPNELGIAVYFRDISVRKKAEEVARIAQEQVDQERQRVLDIFTSIGDAFVSLDREFRFTYLNRRTGEMYLQLTGRPPESFIGITLWDTFPGSYESDFGVAYRQVMSTGIPAQLESYYLPFKTWFEVRVYPSKDGLSIYFADVTAQRKAQLALQVAEERLRMIIDSAKDYAIFALDREGRVTNWNTGAERVFGYSESEIIGQDGAIIYTPEDRAEGIPEAELSKAISLGYSENERWHLHKEGSRIYASGMVRPILDQSGELQGFTKIARDTTDRKLAEQRNRLLQALASKMSAQLTLQEVSDSIIQTAVDIVGGASGSIFLLLPEKQVLQRLSTLNLSRQLVEKYDLLPLDGLTPIADAIQLGKTLSIGTLDELMSAYPHVAETFRANNINAVACIPLMIDDQVLGGLSITFSKPKTLSDPERELLEAVANLCVQAVERARLYEAEAEARQAAEKSSMLKTQFLGMISHELRTPLTSIKGFASVLLAENVALTEKQMQFVQIIDEEADKLTHLVLQLLDLSRMNAGKLQIQLGHHPFADALQVVSAQLGVLTKKHLLNFVLDDDLPLVMMDVHRIAQVIANLIGNAVKFSPIGSTITLSAFPEGQFLHVQIADQGVGIPPAARESVFEAFRQEDNQPGLSTGAGLGLAICKGLIEAHGGRIWVDNNSPTGAKVTFTLPLA